MLPVNTARGMFQSPGPSNYTIMIRRSIFIHDHAKPFLVYIVVHHSLPRFSSVGKLPCRQKENCNAQCIPRSYSSVMIASRQIGARTPSTLRPGHDASASSSLSPAKPASSRDQTLISTSAQVKALKCKPCVLIVMQRRMVSRSAASAHSGAAIRRGQSRNWLTLVFAGSAMIDRRVCMSKRWIAEDVGASKRGVD